MSGYQGRPGPNVSQLINELNNSSHELDFMGDESFGDDLGDLNMFINADFTNYDMPQLPPNSFGGPESLDSFEPPQIDTNTSLPQPTYANYNVPIQPAPPVGGFMENIYPSPMQPASPATGAFSKRKSESTTPQNLSSEEQSRFAAEEDKRRRNTAASARFRVKKKQKNGQPSQEEFKEAYQKFRKESEEREVKMAEAAQGSNIQR